MTSKYAFSRLTLLLLLLSLIKMNPCHSVFEKKETGNVSSTANHLQPLVDFRLYSEKV